MRKIGRDFEDGARQMADRLEALARKSLLADPFDEKADGEEAVLVEPGQPVSVVATIVVDDPTLIWNRPGGTIDWKQRECLTRKCRWAPASIASTGRQLASASFCISPGNSCLPG
jgi:hypothetical protein